MSVINMKKEGDKYVGIVDTTQVKVGEYILDVKITGIRGADGKSAYDVAVENGFEGTEEEWLESIKGIVYEAGDAIEIENDTISTKTDGIWVSVNDDNELTLNPVIQDELTAVKEYYDVWKDVSVPPTAADNKYYGIINNVWEELPYESYSLSDTVISAYNPETDKIEFQSVLQTSFNDDGLLIFENSNLNI